MWADFMPAITLTLSPETLAESFRPGFLRFQAAPLRMPVQYAFKPVNDVPSCAANACRRDIAGFSMTCQENIAATSTIGNATSIMLIGVMPLA